MPATTSPFDLKQLRKEVENASPPAQPIFVPATDGVSIAVRIYRTPTPAKANLVFYHGGGAHSGAGYQLLAQHLAAEHNIQVYTPDLRGHGQSGGPRGDSPSPLQIYEDVDSVLDFVRQENSKELPLFLGGHSSGGGLVIQYATKHDHNKIHGCLMVSPQLGPNSGVANDGGSSSFAKVSILPFILNGICGIMGHEPAVQFQYTDKEIQEDGVVPFNTVNMANAISPTEPAKQLQQMQDSKVPLKLWMGENDELFDSQKVQALYPATKIVPKVTHLGILVAVHKLVGPWIVSALH